MGVVAIENYITCKPASSTNKTTYSQKIRLIDALLNRPLTKLFPANVIVWLQCLHPLNMIGVQPLLSKSATYHKLKNLKFTNYITAGCLLTGFLPQTLEFGVRVLTAAAYPLASCPHFSVEKYHFPVDAVRQPEMSANADNRRAGNFSRYKACDLKPTPSALL
jgi:hypothetical protein